MPHTEHVLAIGIDGEEQSHADRNLSLTGLLALLAGITMLFAAFSSAYIVRRGISSNWTPLPSSVQPWAGATVLLLGSVVLEWRRRKSSRVYVAVIAGLGIIAGVVIIQSWRAVTQAGASASASPAVAFCSIFSSGFLLCLIGGIVALITAAARGTTMARTALYWHYLAGLWLWLLLLFRVWP